MKRTSEKPKYGSTNRLLRVFTTLVLSVSLSGTLHAASTGTSNLYTPNGGDSGTGNGDFVSTSDGLDSIYQFFVEVPPGTTNLTIQVFDADVGAGGTGEATAGRDRQRGTSWNSSCSYLIRNPAGTQVGATTTLANTGGAAAAADNAWITIGGVQATPVAGHWRLDVNMAAGDDINSIGVRAFDGAGNEGALGTELNIYAPSYSIYGSQPGTFSTRNYLEYPYITSGCSCSNREFDMDQSGSISYTSPSALFSANVTPITDNDEWFNFALNGWTDAGVGPGQAPGGIRKDYGLWNRNVSISVVGVAGNYATYYVGAFNVAAAPPTASPQPNTFRVYTPTDAGAKPLKPTARQLIRTVVSGPNPPVSGQTSRLRLRAEISNPTAFPIVFSTPTNIVTINVPTLRVNYQGNAIPSQGSVVSQPAIGAGGNLTWNPGTVAASTTAFIEWDVNVSPTATNQTTILTATPASGNGTRYLYVDETGAQTHLFGPLCQLEITTNGTVLSVNLLSFHATALSSVGPINVEWETVNEIDNAGFLVYRATDSAGIPQIGAQASSVIPATSNGSGGATYSWQDTTPLAPGESRGYYLADIDIAGKVTYHGPVWTNSGAQLSTEIPDWFAY